MTLARGLRVALLTALAYGAAGAAAIALAGPPGYAAPLYPSAGLALAAVLVYGRAAGAGVLLGAFAVNAGLGALRGQPGPGLLLLLPLLIGLGAMLQALAGAWLVRRFVGREVLLNAPRDIALTGLLGALVACLVSPSIATPALVASQIVPLNEALANWLTWWSGDALGVLIAAPLALSFIGQPAADWRPRRRTLGVPLLAALGLVALAVVETDHLHRDRQNAVFEREADRLSSEAQSRLEGALHALKALQGAARARGGLDRDSLREASRWWLTEPFHLQSTGFSERLPAERIPAYEAQARAQGSARYRVFDSEGGAERLRRGEVVAVRHVEPEAGNAGALGLNLLSVPSARGAIEATRRSGQPAATESFRLGPSAGDEPGVVLYQALYSGPATTPEARAALFSGAVFVTLRPEGAMAGLASPGQAFMTWCLTEGIPGAVGAAPPRHWAGPAGCESAALPHGHFHQQRPLAWAGRTLILSLSADPAALPERTGGVTWLLSLSGMAAAALLGALLLTVTGQARRTELAVSAGTDRLQRQVAERLQTEAALRESSERLRSILDNVPLGVMFLDPQGHLIECNPRLCAMAGRSASELLGRSVAELVHPEDAHIFRRLRRDLLGGQASASIDAIRLQVGQGPEVLVRVGASALRSPDGHIVRMVGVMEDITEHLRLEASERALHRAEEANRAKNDFLSRMSHELRTPLNAMIGFAQLLGLDRNPPLAAHQAEWTQQIQRAGWHLLEMINETLDLARIESGALQLNLGPLDVAPMVAACRALVAGLATERNVSFSETLGADASTILGDATRVKQVLTNLLSNAVKYNRKGGSVHIRSRAAAEGRIEILVTDSGLGMDEAQMAALFEPYNRLGRENSGIEGTGIGLVISLRLAELMGGTLSVSSRAGVGSTFTLSLPAADEAERPAPRFTETSPAPYQQRLVHYVEDNETNIEVMRGVLAQRAQVKLKTSVLGLDGLAAIRHDKPDLILLDMHLPDISGLELLRHLKQDVDVAKIPVVVVSADATPRYMEQALTLGALHYVTKPLDVAAFLAVVDSALEAAETRW